MAKITIYHNPQCSNSRGALALIILMNRPIVETAVGTRLCRPPETVLEILPQVQRG